MNREIQCSQDENSLPRQSALWPADVNYDQRCPIRIRFVSSCFSVCSWWTRTTSRSLRRESTSLRDASHSDGVGAGKRLPTILFYRAQRARPALCFEFLTCTRRRFRTPWLQPPLAETSEGFLYLRTKAGRADRI